MDIICWQIERKKFDKIKLSYKVHLEYIKAFTLTRKARTADLKEIVDFLEQYYQEQGIVFIHGRGRRKAIHQRYYEMIRRFLDSPLLYDLHHTRFGEHNSYSKTDVITNQMGTPRGRYDGLV